MGAATRFLMLLSVPLPRLYPRPSALRLRSLAHLSTSAARDRLPIALGNPRRHRPGFAIRAAAEQIHTQAADKPHSVGPAVPQHPWPEWSKLVDYLATRSSDRSSSIGAGSDDDDSFAVHEDLPKEFVRAAGACLALARDRPDALRLLPKKDIEVLVENGSPFLFKNGMNSVRRMISFLSSHESDIPISERAHTVDVVRYLLSYAYNPLHISSVVDPQTKEFLEASIRNLLSELVNVSEISQGSNIIDSPPSQSPVRHDQFSRPARQNIEMKRGDWTCPKCSFLNFARNMRCLECNEGRPKRQLTGGEWECPQCDFFNYGRNMSCLRCDCKRPGGIPLGAPSGACMEQNEKSSLQSSISQSLDRILGRSPPTSGTNQHSAGGNTETRGRFNSVEYGQSMANQRRDPGYVPFVPFPPDMFRKSQETNSETQKSSEQEDLVADKASQFNGSSGGDESDDTMLPERMKNPNESKNDMEQFDKTERWFTKVSELQDSADLANAISGEDFPDIMPIRKGENRFVISKKKDRSLTSPHYKRRMAMEQASNSNFVPFVPFPPDYFAKKDKQPEAGSPVESAAEASPLPKTHEERPEMLNESKSIVSDGISAGSISQPLEIAHTNSNSYSTGFFQKSSNNDFINGGAAGSPDRFSYNTSNNGRESQDNRVSPGSTFDGASVAGNFCQEPDNSRDMRDNGSRGFTGKSLEGSAVTEPDPLDMSEEAKAQRWFKRVAQIKDISELANIPDEDFPEIMPMRKGVNRFVVSKRKTPLERRLTSQQYRRNLPIVSSEPEKKTNSE